MGATDRPDPLLDATTIDAPQSDRDRIGGRFLLGGLIAQGGMGEVYEGWDPLESRPLAIKLLAPRFRSDPDVRARFRLEAEALAKLSHPNIVPVFAVGEDERGPYFVMQRLFGRTLAETVREEGPVAVSAAASVGTAMLGALGFIHAAGFVHRDVKPSNIMIGRDGVCTLLDFGIMRAEESSLTMTGATVGTPEFMAPEQARDPRLADARSDLYSLGATLYFALTGAPPFSGTSAYELINAHHTAEVVPPSARLPGIDAAVDRLIARALAKKPEDRFASADEMSAALAALSSPPARAVPLWRTVAFAAALAIALAAGSWALERAAKTNALAPAASPPAVVPVEEAAKPNALAPAKESVAAAPAKHAPPPVKTKAITHGARVGTAAHSPRQAITAPPAGPSHGARVGPAAHSPRQEPPKEVAPASLRIVTLDRGLSTYAEVQIDDLPPRQAPIADWSIAPGEHTIVARREGYLTRELKLTVAEGEKKKIELHLERAP